MHKPIPTLPPAERLRSSLGQLIPLVKAVRSDADAFLTGDDAEDGRPDLAAIDRAITCADTAMALILAAVEGGGPDAREPLTDLAALLRALRAFQAAIAGTDDHYMPLRSVVETLKRYEERGAAYFDASGEYAITLNKLTPADASRDLHNALADLVACSHREADFVSLGERRAKGRPYPEGQTRSLLRACDDADAAITRALDAIARGGAGLLDNAKNPGATAQTLGLRVELGNARALWRSLRAVVSDPDARLSDEADALRAQGRAMNDRCTELTLLLNPATARAGDAADTADTDKTPAGNTGEGVVSADHFPLEEFDLTILTALSKRTPLIHATRLAAIDGMPNEDTINNRLRAMEKATPPLVERPTGERKGYRITPDGRAVLASALKT